MGGPSLVLAIFFASERVMRPSSFRSPALTVKCAFLASLRLMWPSLLVSALTGVLGIFVSGVWEARGGALNASKRARVSSPSEASRPGRFFFRLGSSGRADRVARFDPEVDRALLKRSGVVFLPVTRARAMYRRLVRCLAGSLGGFAALASTGRSARACATWSAATAARGASAAEGALRVSDRASSLGHRGRGFAASGVLRNAAPPASRRTMVRGKTKGVGVHVGADGDVDRAMRKLKRVMINEGIEKSVKKRLVFLKGSDARVVAKRERDHRKWKKALRSKLGWIMRRKDRGF